MEKLGLLLVCMAVACGRGSRNAGDLWQPGPGTSWQWQLQGEVDISLDVDMYDIDVGDQLDFNRFLAEAAHDRGLSIGLQLGCVRAASMKHARATRLIPSLA